MAEYEQLVESLESLWFFGNALSSPILPTANLIPSLESEKEQSNQITVIQSSDVVEQDEDFNSELKPSPPKEEFEPLAVNEKQSNEGGGGGGRAAGEIVVFQSKPESPLERRKRMARRSRSNRKILLELDLCFDDLIDFSPWSYGGGAGGCNFERDDRGKIPSSKNSTAMNRHLKSGTHNVTCIVK
ncbi:unnamed protein product [Linum trigynum]|uniref:Uncharacterized protein n=1 Tax=Linum trigynum TaxID=586398 RepID=A0AAV2GJI0_9ROSI